MQKKVKITGKKVYDFDTKKFYKVLEQKEGSDIVVSDKNGNKLQIQKWIIANSLYKVIDGIVKVIQYQNTIIDNMTRDMEILQVKHPELFNNQKN